MRSTGRNTLPTAPIASIGPAGPSRRTGVLARSLVLIDAFGATDQKLSLAELSRRSGLAKSTVHRIAAEMCEERLLARAEDGGYTLGLRLFEMGERVPAYRSLADAAHPLMEDLREATRHRVHLAVLDGVDVVYVLILGSAGGRISSRTGGRLPAHATGVGKVILAYSPVAVLRARVDAGLTRFTPRTVCTPGALHRELQKIRTVGMALDLEESHLGVSCVAAPVFGADHKIRAGLSVTGPTRTIDPGTLGPAVRTAAFALSRVLRDSGL